MGEKRRFSFAARGAEGARSLFLPMGLGASLRCHQQAFATYSDAEDYQTSCYLQAWLLARNLFERLFRRVSCNSNLYGVNLQSVVITMRRCFCEWDLLCIAVSSDGDHLRC